MMSRIISFFILIGIFLNVPGLAQNSEETTIQLEDQLLEKEAFRKLLVNRINYEKWSIYKNQLKSYGLPSSNYLEHTAYFFDYSEEHEQATWVAHMITPEVEDLGSSRTNDFRIDPLVSTGTADQEDYFIYHPKKRRSV